MVTVRAVARSGDTGGIVAYRIITCCDAAYGESARADYTVFATGARDMSSPTPKVHLLDIWRNRVPIEEIPNVAAMLYSKWEPEFIGFENTLWQSSIIRALRLRGDIPFREIDRRKARNPDKKTRAGNLAFHYQEHHIVHPTPAPPWLPDFEQELLSFTGDPGRDDHDDQVDAWVDCVDFLTLQRAGETEMVVHNVSWNKPKVNTNGVLLTDPRAARLAKIIAARDEALV